MNAAVVSAFGEPPRYTTFADPSPQPGEEIVEVRAAGLHRIVRAIAAGKHYLSAGTPPFVPGLDGAGVLGDGRRVFFAASRPPFGTFAERSVALRSRCLPIPDTLDDVTAAAIANPAMSSWAALTVRTHMEPGAHVLVIGATGIAGALAVQIAKHLGAGRVVAAGRNREALDALMPCGADALVPLGVEQDALVDAFRKELREHGIDVVLDYVWGTAAEAFFEAVTGKSVEGARRIRYLQIGSMGGATAAVRGEMLRSSGLELMGSGFGSAPIERIFESIGAFFASAAGASFRIDVRAVPLRDVAVAWNEEGRARTVFVP